MPFPHDLRRGLIASVLLCAALQSSALTLGRSRGVALIGRTLDITIPVTLDNPGQAGDLCPSAEVFQGDSRLDAAQVSAQVEAGAGSDAVVRVRTTQAVDEPVVTVYLRLGCVQRSTRRYVLLSEQPGEYVPPIAAALPAVPSAAASRSPAAAAPAPAAAAAGAVPRGGAGRSATARAARPAPAADAAAAAPRAAAQAERALAQAPQGRGSPVRSRSRLSIDLLDLQTERDPRLRFSTALAGEPSANEQIRAQAAALWRSLNAQPEDVLRDLQRVQALETDVKSLRTLITGNDQTLAELRGQLEQARQERTLTLAAIALMALLLAAMVVSWWLKRGERAGYAEWWKAREGASPAATAGADPAPAPKSPAPVRASDLDLRVDESMFESLKQPPRAAPLSVAPAPHAPRAPALDDAPASGFQSSQLASMRMVKAEELVDIQQQADFFMSLGQTEQAIEVLESHIRNNAETSALVWLDLLAIYRALKRREDYELLRSDFLRVFNAEVPSYDTTPSVSGGLEDYPRALSRIAALWPSPKVLDLIEESIFRKPGAAEGKPFDLEAYRELVMLYNLGREVVQAVAVPGEEWTLSQSPASTFFETSMQPLSTAVDSRSSEPDVSLPSEADSMPLPAMPDTPIDIDSVLLDDEPPGTTLDEFPDPQMPRPSPRLGLDIDLSGPVKPAKPTTPTPAPAQDSSIDFELSAPGDDAPAGQKPGDK